MDEIKEMPKLKAGDAVMMSLEHSEKQYSLGGVVLRVGENDFDFANFIGELFLGFHPSRVHAIFRDGKLLWTALLLFLLASSAVAEPLTVLIDRNRYMRRSIAGEIAKESVKNQPIKVNYRLRVSPRSDCYKINEWNSNQLDCFKKVRKNIRGRVLFLTEPYIENGILYTTGRANVCISWGTGYCNITEKNNDGESRIEKGKAACTHELGHLLGAYHDNNFYGDCPSIMHEAPLSFVDQCPLAFSGRSKNQILACDRRSK